MLSKNKVIHIDFGLSQEFSSLNNLAFGSWAKRFIKNAKLFTNSYDFELWKVYDTNIFGDRGIQIFERNGIRSKVFPAKRVLPFSKSNSSYISLSLLKNIKLLSNKDKKYIVLL